MLPKMVQKVFDEYDEKHAKEIKMNRAQARERVKARPTQPWKHEYEHDLDIKIAYFEYRQSVRREIKTTQYLFICTSIIIGILQAIYFTYLLT